MDREASATAAAREANRAALRIGLILGVGLMGSIDEIVFHQLLRWHHFYDRAGPTWETVSDGLLHALTATMLVAGAVLLWAERRRLVRLGGARPIWAGVLMGMGGFQLFDGIVDHKVLRLHQIRDTDNLLAYDVVWNGVAVVAIMAGWVLWRGRGGAVGTEEIR